MGSAFVVALALQAATGWPWTGDAEPHASALMPGKVTVIQARLDEQPVVMRITSVMVAGCHAANWLHGAVPDRNDRCTRLGRVDITVAGKPMALSSAGYADLGGINDVVLRSAPGKLVLYMRGPDGPEYYGATLTFDRNDIVRRQLDYGDGSGEITTWAAAAADAG